MEARLGIVFDVQHSTGGDPGWDQQWSTVDQFRCLHVLLSTSLTSCASTDGSPRNAVFFVTMALFSVSSGFISTLIMLAAVVDPILDEAEIDVSESIG